ncbi:MAG: hypothetical protein AAF152_07195 [Cyanobacteria bacterium P01_A01_bin.114]
MKSSSSKISVIVRGLKGLAIALTCAVMLFSSSMPAFAFGMNKSANPSEGAAQLDQVQQESEKVSNSQPRGRESVQTKAERGLNGVQGAADTGKMKSPSDASGATTVKEQVEGALDSALN